MYSAPRSGRAPNSERTTATLTRIRDAARKVFYAKGFHASSVEEIAEESGVSRATIYLYFRSKDEILVDLLNDDLDYQMALYDKLVAIRRLSKSTIRQWLEEFRAVQDERRGSFNLFSVAFNLVPDLTLNVDRHRAQTVLKLGGRYRGFDLDALDRAARNLQRVKCYMMIFLIEECTVTFSIAPSAPTLKDGLDILSRTLLNFLKTGEIRTDA